MRVRGSSFLSRGVVVGAFQTAARSGPSASRRSRSACEITRGLSFSRRSSSILAVSSAQALLPVAFEAARHQPVVGIDSAIAMLGALRFVIGSLDPEPPLLQSGFAFDFQPLSGGQGGGKPSRLQGSDEGPSDGRVDLDTADIEAIDAAVLDENLARAVVTWRSVATTIVGVQTATAMATAGQPWQKCAALPHSAARLVRSGLCIAGEAFLVCLIGLPVNEARMMLRDQHLPFGAREVSHALLAPAGGIEADLVAGSAIDLSAGVDGVGEHPVDGGVARLDPSDLAALMHLQREFDKANGQATPEFAARRLVANAARNMCNSASLMVPFKDGGIYPNKEGIPQGGSISVMLSNLYLHYVLDLWSKLVEFGRFAQQHAAKHGRKRPETIYFLGFTLYCTRNLKGTFRIGLRIEKSRLRRSLMSLQDLLRRIRHLSVREQVSSLNTALRGHYAYYGIAGNFRSLQKIYRAVERCWHKMLCSRSWAGRITLDMLTLPTSQRSATREFLLCPAL
jgi:hypothetical protein